MLRYRKVITNNDNFIKCTEKLRVTLTDREYKDIDILPCLYKAASFTQSQLLILKDTQNTLVTSFVIPYDPNLNSISNVLRQHWSYMEDDKELSQIWPNPPIVTY